METDELRKDAKGLAVSQEVQVQFSFPCLDRDLSSLRRSEMLRRPSYLAAMSWIMEPINFRKFEELVFCDLWFPVSGFRIPDSGFRFPVSGFRFPVSGFLVLGLP